MTDAGHRRDADAARGAGACRTSGTAARGVVTLPASACSAPACRSASASPRPARRSSSPAFGGGLQPGPAAGPDRRGRPRCASPAAPPGGLPVPRPGWRSPTSCDGPGTTSSTGPDRLAAAALVRGASPPAPRRRRAPLAVDMESAWLAGRLLATDPTPHRRRPRASSTPRATSCSTPRALRNGLIAYAVLRRIGPVLDAVGRGRRRRARSCSPSPRSFCAGVERAIAIVERALERYGAPVYVRRQIVHNTHVVADLAARGRGLRATSSTRCRTGAGVVLAAHGVAPGGPRRGRGAADLHVIDATCPLVAKVHAEVRRFAATRLPRSCSSATTTTRRSWARSGEAPDAIARGRARPRTSPSSTVADPRAGRLPHPDHARRRRDGRGRRARCASASPRSSVRAPTTSATPPRTARRRCASSSAGVDLVLVVGSRNSSNSNRLVEVAAPRRRRRPPGRRTRRSSTWPGSPARAASASPPARRRPSTSCSGSSQRLGQPRAGRRRRARRRRRGRPASPCPWRSADAHPPAPEPARRPYLMQQKLRGREQVPADRRARAAVRLQPGVPGLRQDPAPDRRSCASG